MRRAGMLGIAIALSLTMARAQAVDVDRIEVRSGLGEPLIAEIPVTGATPQELQQLQAQLASSTTFARIGLPRPQGVVADLHFEVVRGPRPVIRVTSTLPVQEEFLTFLLQVDAPQGRLVREYSVSLGASPSLPAQVAPQIQAPVQGPGNAVVRAPDPADALPAPVEPAIQVPESAPTLAAPPIPVASPAPAPIPLSGDRRPTASAQRPAVAPSPAPARAARPQATAPRPQASAAAARPQPAIRRPAPPAPASAPTQRQPGDYVVRPGDNLTGIVERMGIDGATPQQAMAALLRTNPQAFGSGNVNLLHRGAVLRTPSPAELSRLDPAAAEALVQLQIQQWRSGNMPPVAPAAAMAAAPAASPAPAPVPPAADTASRIATPRLEIAPAADPSTSQAGSGGAPGAGGTAAQRERAAADLVAARYTDFQQMQQRIAELEQAQQAQQHLIELQNRQLAAQRPQAAGFWPWLVAAFGIAIVAAAAWRRARPDRPGRVAARMSTLVQGEKNVGARAQGG